MDVDILWDELRKQQLANRDKNIFEKYDRIFLQEFTCGLNKYRLTMLKAAGLSESDYADLKTTPTSLSKLNQMQVALFYHAEAIDRLNQILSKLLEGTCTDPIPSSVIDPATLWSKLPKLDIAKEFVSDNIPRYGRFLANLQTTNPEVFRAQNIIAKQAQHELALNIFHTLRNIFPQLLSSQGLSNHLSRLFKDILDKSKIETEHPSKFTDLWQYLKRATKDTTLNVLFDIVQAMNLDTLVSKSFAHFLVTKTDEIDEDELLITAVELAELSQITQTDLNQDYFKDYISKIKKQRFDDLEILLNSLIKKVAGESPDRQRLKNLLDRINILTPLEKEYRKDLKGKIIPQEKLLFNQKNVAPIINEITQHLSPVCNEISKSCKTEIERSLLKLKSMLAYNRQQLDTEVDNIVQKIERKTTLAKLYPSTPRLTKAIAELTDLIAHNTKKNIFGTKIKNQVAKDAEIYRRELLYLLRDRVTCSLNNAPVPDLKNWDSFLLNDYNGPLHKDTSWQNCFFSFTALGTGPRFPGLLADQLAALNNIMQLKDSIATLLLDHKETLPPTDVTELSKDKIVGIKHLADLNMQLNAREQKLKNFILYLQFASITAILSKVDKPSPELTTIQVRLQQWCDAQKAQAANSAYLPCQPSQAELVELSTAFEQLKTTSPDSFKKITDHFESISDAIGRTTSFYFGGVEQKQSAINMASRSSVRVEDLSGFRKFILTLLGFCSTVYTGVFVPVYEFFHGLAKAHEPKQDLKLKRTDSAADLQLLSTCSKSAMAAKTPETTQNPSEAADSTLSILSITNTPAASVPSASSTSSNPSSAQSNGIKTCTLSQTCCFAYQSKRTQRTDARNSAECDATSAARIAVGC